MESASVTRTRREYFVDGYAEYIALATRLVDWRAVPVALLLAGIGAGALSLVSTPPFQALVFLIYSLVITLWALRRNQSARRLYARLGELVTEGSATHADRDATADLPLHKQTPTDARTIDELDHMLRLRKPDRDAAAASARGIRVGLNAYALFALASVLTLAVAATIVTTPDHRTFSVVADLLFAVAAVAPGIVIYRDAASFLAFTTREAKRNLEEARRRLAELSDAEAPYESGEVIKWTGAEYVIDIRRLTLQPIDWTLSRLGGRLIPWAFVGFAICFAIIWAAEAALHSVTMFLF
jgi:hypothetical protein